MIDEISEGKLERIEDRIIGAYDKVLGSLFICPDARLKEKLKNIQEAIKDFQTYLEMVQNGDEEFIPVESSRKSIKSSFEIYKGAKFKNGNDAIIEIVRKDDDGYVLFKTHDGSIHDTTEESMRNILEFNNYVPVESSKVTVLEGTIL